MVYSRSENCVFPALRCGPAGQGFAPGNTMFYGWNICVSGTILTCLMVGSGLNIPLAGAIFWMYFILVLQFRKLCYVYLYCEKVQNIMKYHEKRAYNFNFIYPKIYGSRIILYGSRIIRSPFGLLYSKIK
jgi:hypothetical protein